MNFDEIIDRRNTHSSKWDRMEPLYGVSPKDGLSMWVADMDFRSPQVVQDAVQKMVDHGVYGYYGDFGDYKPSIQWWMKTRHNWEIETDWIFSTHGLVNGTALCVQTWTDPGDAVILFTPVYYVFAQVIKDAGREVHECPLVNNDGRYEMDLEAAAASLTGKEKMVVLCSPHNPGGRVWAQEELRAIADFCVEHDLILVSDEIHHDLVYSGHKHIPMPLATPDISDRLVTMTAPSKTFNIAGAHNGNVIISDPKLHAEFKATSMGLRISPNAFGVAMETAAYSTEGAIWLDALMDYLAGNKAIFEDGVNSIPGLSAMPLEATYLEWVDFSDTGMAQSEFIRRVQEDARIAPQHGGPFGTGGEDFLRFNIGMPRARIVEAVERLQNAFADLQ